MNNNNPFMNDGHLDISASLNKINMVELGGVSWSRRLSGKTAHQVLSSAAVADIVSREFAETDGANCRQLGLLHAALASLDETARAKAEKVCREIAASLGCLILLLAEQNINRSAARLDWDDEQWRWWKSMERVVVGGGCCPERLEHL